MEQRNKSVPFSVPFSVHRRPHLRVWLHSQPSGGAWRESHSARQPGVDCVALRVLPASAWIVCRPGAMADRLSAGVRRMGGTGGCHLSARVRLPLGNQKSGTDRFMVLPMLITWTWITVHLQDMVDL